MAKKAQIPPGTLEMLILRSLEEAAPMHGYGVAQYIRRTTDEVLQVEEGSLYPALQRLLVKGWVVGEWQMSDKNRRARFYTLTTAGRKQLGAEVEEFRRVTQAIQQVIDRAGGEPRSADG